jgi:hypothetical protein
MIYMDEGKAMNKEQIEKIKRFRNPRAQLIVLRSIVKAELKSVKNTESLQSRKNPV